MILKVGLLLQWLAMVPAEGLARLAEKLVEQLVGQLAMRPYRWFQAGLQLSKASS